jgi:competence protein ComEC
MEEFFATIKTKVALGLVLVLLVLNIMVWPAVFLLAGPNYLKVAVLDIGQGDSIFIQTPSHRTMLIDGGPGTAVLGKLSRQLPFWDKHLDVVLLTHPDQDHLLGLLSVLKKYKVDYIVWTGIVRDGANYQEWIRLLEQKNKEGSHIILADSSLVITSGPAVLRIVNPKKSLAGAVFSKADNDTGIVARLEYGKNSFLFTADVSSNVEKDLLRRKVSVASEVLKVGHHGSKYSSSDAFLQAVNPKLAIISVGKNNSYGHPTPEVLQKLAKFAIKTLRTDEFGDVTVLADGENIKINNLLH